MKTLANCHVCNHCVIDEKTFIYLSGPVSYRDFRETDPWCPFLEIPDNLPAPISIFLNVFSPITGMVLGQCIHRIIKVLKFNIQR